MAEIRLSKLTKQFSIGLARLVDFLNTGLGLSIVKHAAAYHDAEISLDSTPGKGTTITIQF